MQTRQIVVLIPEESFTRLQTAADAQKKTVENLAAELVLKSLPAAENPPAKCFMPGVALIKNDFMPEASVKSLTDAPAQTTAFASLNRFAAGNSNNSGSASNFTMTGKPTISNAQSPEKLQRRQALDAQIKELSLLIDTAEPHKKEEYLLQYAMLAAELDSLI